MKTNVMKTVLTYHLMGALRLPLLSVAEARRLAHIDAAC